MAVDVDAIKARLAAATPGPWEWRNTDARVRLTRRSDNGLVMSFARCGMQDAQPVLRGPTGFHERTSRRNLYEFPDANLIAHAPSDIAALVAEVERLRHVAEAAAEAIDAKTERDGLSYYGAKPEGWGDKMDANTARSRSAYVLLVAAVREWREAGE